MGPRDQALVAVFLATGPGYRSVVQEITVSGLDRVTGEFAVGIKGGREHLCKLSPPALKLVTRSRRARRGPRCRICSGTGPRR